MGELDKIFAMADELAALRDEKSKLEARLSETKANTEKCNERLFAAMLNSDIKILWIR